MRPRLTQGCSAKWKEGRVSNTLYADLWTEPETFCAEYNICPKFKCFSHMQIE
jgi:hypothetical protein